MRDEVFYRLHALIDSLYLRLKAMSPAYTKKDLDFEGISLKQVEVQTPTSSQSDRPWPKQILNRPTPVIITMMESNEADISRSSRPCTPVSQRPSATAPVRTLAHVPFKYSLVISSSRSEPAFGMVRVFMAPEAGVNGRRFTEDEVHHRAIEIDRVPVVIPQGDTQVTRSSLQSTVTRRPFPSIRQLYESPGEVPARTCGYPNHLLIPKGNAQGLRFKMFFVVSEEPTAEMNHDAQFPYCGSLHGKRYPDARSMGYPFDRPGTRFVHRDTVWGIIGQEATLKNVRTLNVIVRHRQN